MPTTLPKQSRGVRGPCSFLEGRMTRRWKGLEGMGAAGKGGAEEWAVETPPPPSFHGKLTGSTFFGEKNGSFSLKQDRMRAKSARAK